MPAFGVLAMDERLQSIFDNVPEDEPRSRLEPYRELIFRWRRQGRTYRRICQILAEECGVRVTCGPLCRFVQRRSRPSKVQPELECESFSTAPVAGPPPASPEQAATKVYIKLSPEKAAAQRQFVRALRNKPVIVPTEEARELFVYDPSKPLTNKPTKE